MKKIYFSIISLLFICCLGYSLCVGVAQAQDAKSKEKSIFDDACQKNTIKDYGNYLKQYPDGEFASEAKLKIEALRWEKVKTTSSIVDVEEYLKAYPDGTFASEAEQKIMELVKEKCNQNVDEFIASYERQYNENIAPAYDESVKAKKKGALEYAMARLPLVGAFLDIQELEAMWDHCYIEKATSEQKDRYSETAKKVEELEKELTEAAK